MRLLVFAHKLEAKPFIDHLQLSKEGSFRNLYVQRKKQKTPVLLTYTGEGIWSALSHLSHLLGYCQINSTTVSLPTEIHNLGVCGSLSEHLHLAEIVRISQCKIESTPFAHPSGRIFEVSSPENRYCISSLERVLEPHYADSLRSQADVVDREAWGLAYSANRWKIPFYCTKIISDKAGQNSHCNDVKQKSAQLMTSLFDYYISNF